MVRGERALKGSSMEKWLCWGGMGISGGLMLLFVLDLLITIPYGGLSKMVDILGVLSCAMVLYLSWDAFRDLR